MSKQVKLPLPERVYPLGIPFQVQLVDSIDDGASDGETIDTSRIIRISATQDTRRRWTTLLHEYIHATLHVNGATSGLDEALEEVIAQSLEHSLEQFLLAHGSDILKALEVQK